MFQQKFVRTLAASVTCSLLIFSGYIFASMQVGASSKSVAEEIINREVSNLTDKLQLTVQQQQTIKPILEKAHKAKLDIREQAGLNENGVPRGKTLPASEHRKLMKNLRDIDKQTNNAFIKVLDKKQIKQWKSWRTEKQNNHRHFRKVDNGGR